MHKLLSTISENGTFSAVLSAQSHEPHSYISQFSSRPTQATFTRHKRKKKSSIFTAEINKKITLERPM